MTGYQRVPPFQIPAFDCTAISTGLGQPSKAADIFRGYFFAFRDGIKGFCVNRTGASIKVKEAAGDFCKKYLSRFSVREPIEAADTTSAAQRLPFRGGHVTERFLFPKRIRIHGGPKFAFAGKTARENTAVSCITIEAKSIKSRIRSG
jgi:hypothetical protein